MSRTYTTTAIVLKATPLGEADRLLTLLSPDQGLLRVVATGARKPRSKLGGRTALFVVGDCLIACGKSLDRLQQVETLTSHTALSGDLARLAAAQYLTELVLAQALERHPQPELFALLCRDLARIETQSGLEVLPYLLQSTWQLLAWAGWAPQTHYCCLTQQAVQPRLEQPRWRVRYSPSLGGVLADTAAYQRRPNQRELLLTATELAALQQIPTSATVLPLASLPREAWQMLERALRHSAEYHLERPLQSALLLETLLTGSHVASV